MSRSSWALTLLLLAVTAILVWREQVHYVPGPVTLNVVVALVFAPIGFVYTYLRYDARVAGACDSVAVMATFTMIAAVYTYVATVWGAGAPLHDAQLAQADRVLGLDWRTYLAWLDRHPRLGLVLEHCYDSILKQLGALVLCLVILGRVRRLQTFILATQLSLLVCGTAPAIFPALGIYPYLHIAAGTDHPHLAIPAAGGAVQEIERLRSAMPSFRLDAIVGVVVFPSFHTVLVVLFAWAFWPVPVVRWVALVLNAGMLAATPLSGGHYFVDVAAGFAVALASLGAAQAWSRRVDQWAARTAVSQPGPSSVDGLRITA